MTDASGEPVVMGNGEKEVWGYAWIQCNSKASVGKKWLLPSPYWLIRDAELNCDYKPKSYRTFKHKNKPKSHIFLFFVKLQFHFPPIRIQGQGTFLGTFLHDSHYTVLISGFTYLWWGNLPSIHVKKYFSHPGKSWDFNLLWASIQNGSFSQNGFSLVRTRENTEVPGTHGSFQLPNQVQSYDSEV